MTDRHLTTGTLRRAIPALALAVVAVMLALSSVAGAADDPPVVSLGPIDAGGSNVTGSAGSDPEADTCIGDRHSGADAEDAQLLQLNDAGCQSGSGGGVGATGTGGAQTTGGGARPAGTAGTAGRGSTLTSVAAADAVGLRIVGVKRLLKNVRLTKNFRMLVTIKDGRGFRVRGAIVAVSRVPGSQSTVSGLHAGFSNKIGVARVLVPVTSRMFGKRIFLKITARTPKARAVTLRSVFLPRLR